jgi:hypothetical protein
MFEVMRFTVTTVYLSVEVEDTGYLYQFCIFLRPEFGLQREVALLRN